MASNDPMDSEDRRQKQADELVQKAIGFLDPAIRANYVAERLAKLDEQQVTHILHLLFRGAARRLPGYREFLESGIEPWRLREKLGRFKFSRVYHFANRNGYSDIVALFSGSRAARTPDGEEDLFQVYGMADRTVGERRFYARSKEEVLLDKIGYDPNPMVIRQLLMNPRLRESDVMKIAARRPNMPDVLTEIYKNKKWLSRYEIKLALVSNPYTPPQLSRSLLPFLLHKHLKSMISDGTLAPEVRQEAFRLFRAKKGEKQSEETERG